MTQTPPSPSPALQDEIQRGLDGNNARVFRIEVEGKTYWVKRPETRTLFTRLQKGSAAKTFERERLALRTLPSKGIPVSPLVAEGDGYFVTMDQGTPIIRMLENPDTAEPEKVRIMQAAARALAGMHCKNLSHGRPNVKDICWDGERISFIDFERFSPGRNTLKGHAQDVILFLFSAYSVNRQHTPEIEAAIIAYREAAPDGVWSEAATWCRRRGWFARIVAFLSRFRDSRELVALPLTFKAISTKR